ncbi:2,3-diaminopropionate biosynthesis protein SbnA [Marinicrinis sediminis]|uniref:N-(2-amino-2-carboxyethyl)-L-glutamate synthase n=1 Tax=Marinicrinis sediminis TaxID=1652465 RepID=A0ABW5RA74_9BACL
MTNETEQIFMRRHGYFSAVGHTPLVKLGRLFSEEETGLEVYAKLELLNPGGSAKDRPALSMLKRAWTEGRIGENSVILESSSGNMAISLASLCACLGIRFISVVDPKTTAQNLRLIQAYGGEIEAVTEPDPVTGEYLPARLHRIQSLLAEIPDSCWLNQYENEANYLSHQETMAEIADRLGHVDVVLAGVSTCGTVRGLSEYVRKTGGSTKVLAVDAKGSSIFGGVKGPRRFPGLGAGISPPFSQGLKVERVIEVSDEQMVQGCHALLQQESLMGGASSGGVIAALQSIAPTLQPGTVCVVLLHDRGERYLDTVYCPAWLEAQFGSIKPEADRRGINAVFE